MVSGETRAPSTSAHPAPGRCTSVRPSVWWMELPSQAHASTSSVSTAGCLHIETRIARAHGRPERCTRHTGPGQTRTLTQTTCVSTPTMPTCTCPRHTWMLKTGHTCADDTLLGTQAGTKAHTHVCTHKEQKRAHMPTRGDTAQARTPRHEHKPKAAIVGKHTRIHTPKTAPTSEHTCGPTHTPGQTPTTHTRTQGCTRGLIASQASHLEFSF